MKDKHPLHYKTVLMLMVYFEALMANFLGKVFKMRKYL